MTTTRTRTRKPRVAKVEQAPVVSTELVVIEPELAKVVEAELVETDAVEDNADAAEADYMYLVSPFGAKDEQLSYYRKWTWYLADEAALDAFRALTVAPVAGQAPNGKRRGIITLRAFDREGNVVATIKPQELKAARRAIASS